MKKKVQEFIKQNGGESKYSGKDQTMWVSAKDVINAANIKADVLREFGTLPFKIEISKS